MGTPTDPQPVYTHPLTTRFTPPSSCWSTRFTLSPDGSDILNTTTTVSTWTLFESRFWPRTSTEIRITGAFDSACYPPDFYPSETSSDATPTPNVYAPGVIPALWRVADYTSRGSMVHATCCPSGDWSIDGSGSCYSIPLSPATIVQSKSTQTVSVDVQIARPIHVAWDPAHKPTPASEVYTSSTGTPWTPTHADTMTHMPSSELTASSDASSTTRHDLSSGAKAGIGAEVAVGVIVIAIGVFFLWRQLKKRRAAAQDDEKSDGSMIEMDGESKAAHAWVGELSNEVQLNEAHGESNPAELEHGNGLLAELEDTQPVELDAGWTGWEAPAGNTGASSHREGQGHLDDIAKR